MNAKSDVDSNATLNAFREVVLVEYPRRGLWVIGFVTGSTKGEVARLVPGSNVNVFIPTTPNPTSGFLLFCPVKDVIRLDMTNEEAVKLVVSGGIVSPPDRAISAGKAAKKPTAKKAVLKKRCRVPKRFFCPFQCSRNIGFEVHTYRVSQSELI